MQHDRYPILEFDPSPEAMVEPSRVLKPIDIPDRCVLCFYRKVIETVTAALPSRVLTHLASVAGRDPVHEVDWAGHRLAVTFPGVGAPWAAAKLEELIAVGCRKFIVVGSGGVLIDNLPKGHIIVPTSAVRDEGCSYHYLPPGREVSPSPAAVQAIQEVLTAHGCPYVSGKIWTTDAFYRETPARVKRRRDEGCIAVDMEASALFAVAKFRNVIIGQILLAGDDLSGDQWDDRQWDHMPDAHEKEFQLAAEACLRL